jgi:hypothetical protein
MTTFEVACCTNESVTWTSAAAAELTGEFSLLPASWIVVSAAIASDDVVVAEIGSRLFDPAAEVTALSVNDGS